MSEMDYLNYRPDFTRDKKEKTGWIEPADTLYIDKDDVENVYKGKELEITNEVNKYNDFKNKFEERVEELEKNLSSIEIPLNDTTKKALEESGHKSTFTPDSFRKLFEKKESSVGEYLIGVLEKNIEGENGSIDWEIFIEYLEIEEELNVLEEYMKSILFPILSKNNLNVNDEDEIKELEKQWVEKTIDNVTKHTMGQLDYEYMMIANAELIAKARDNLHDLKEGQMHSVQQVNQVETTLTTLSKKRISLEQILNEIDSILDIKTSEKIVKELLELIDTEDEEKEKLKDTVILLKQSIDQDNDKKKDIKYTRRNLYSENKQKRIIDEYSSINHLYRENSLPTVHYMKSFQDNTSEELNNAFNQFAKSVDRNHRENREKAYETHLIQISTSQTRMNRLKCVESKQESRLMFQEILNKYKETN